MWSICKYKKWSSSWIKCIKIVKIDHIVNQTRKNKNNLDWVGSKSSRDPARGCQKVLHVILIGYQIFFICVE